jgi:hypothetical protein
VPPEVQEVVAALQDRLLLHLHLPLLLCHPLPGRCHLPQLLLNQVLHQHLLMLQGLLCYVVGSALLAVVQGWCWGHP